MRLDGSRRCPSFEIEEMHHPVGASRGKSTAFGQETEVGHLAAGAIEGPKKPSTFHFPYLYCTICPTSCEKLAGRTEGHAAHDPHVGWKGELQSPGLTIPQPYDAVPAARQPSTACVVCNRIDGGPFGEFNHLSPVVRLEDFQSYLSCDGQRRAMRRQCHRPRSDRLRRLCNQCKLVAIIR